jgi:hypothetical protein
MIEGYSFYKIQHAIRLHFTTSYDAIKYSGKTKLDKASYENRNDRAIFEKYAKKCVDSKDATEICIANMLIGNEDWLYESSDTAVRTYNKWKKYQTAIVKYVEDDTEKLCDYVRQKKVKKFYDLFETTPNGNRPPVLQLLFTGNILHDTINSYDSINGGKFIKRWLKQYELDPMLSDKLFRLKKYKPFSKIVYNQRMQDMLNSTNGV